MAQVYPIYCPRLPLGHFFQPYIQGDLKHEYVATPGVMVHWEYLKLYPRELLIWGFSILVHLRAVVPLVVRLT